jgi:hypothetical protein
MIQAQLVRYHQQKSASLRYSTAMPLNCTKSERELVTLSPTIKWGLAQTAVWTLQPTKPDQSRLVAMCRALGTVSDPFQP